MTSDVRGRAELRARWYREGVFGSVTLADEIRRGAREHPDVPVVFHSQVRGTATITLGQMYERSSRIAGALQALGIGRGDVVAVQVPNWLEGALAQEAAALVGAVIVPLVHIYGPSEVGFILRQSRARLFIVPDQWRSSDYLDTLERLADLPDLEHTVVIGERVPAGALAWDDLEGWYARPYTAPESQHPDDMCLFVYTAGTTGESKGVQHSHNSLFAEVWAESGAEELGTETKHLAVFPTGHIAGLLGLLRVLVRATSSVLMDAWDAEVGASLVERHGITSGVGPPFYLATLLDAGERDGRDLSSLREYMVGAANVSPALIERADAAGIRAYRTYGSSEHPTISSGLPSDPLVKRATTDGRATAYTQIRIVDDDGTDVAAGRDGEIVVRGPEQFLGYRDARLDEESYLDGGWLRTGDVGYLDPEGYLTITDRKKDVVVRGGENISSKEVEDVLLTHPAVAEAGVVGYPDELYGQRVCAFVVPREGPVVDLDAVREHFACAGVAKQKVPERLVTVDALPRNAAGKIKKFELRALLETAE